MGQIQQIIAHRHDLWNLLTLNSCFQKAPLKFIEKQQDIKQLSRIHVWLEGAVVTFEQ